MSLQASNQNKLKNRTVQVFNLAIFKATFFFQWWDNLIFIETE